MVNSWSLADSVLNGTLDEDYPIMTKKEDEYDIPKQDSAYPHSTSWYDYNRNDPDRENPFTEAFDHLMGESVTGKTPWIYESPDGGKTVYRYERGTDPLKRELINTEGQKKESMAHYFKYHEEEILKDIEEYVSSTYRGHYTGDTHEYRNVQTLDLMAARSVASGFCQANILKYGSRYGSKDGKNKKDLLKVIHYAMLLLHFDDHYGKPSMPSGNFEQMP